MVDAPILIPERDLGLIRTFCAGRIPARVAHLVRLDVDVDGRAVTIVERRPPWRSDFGPDWSRSPIARLRYVASRAEWTLYWCDRHLRFHRYELLAPDRDVSVLLAEIEADPVSIFWG